MLASKIVPFDKKDYEKIKAMKREIEILQEN